MALMAVFSHCAISQELVQQVVAGRKNSPQQMEKPYLILISADGFRYDYAEKYNARNILELSSKGIRSAAMIPSYPSVTFPNHYTIVTGLYPSHHGLVYNQFYDRGFNASYSMGDRSAVEDGRWYGGTPLWVLAEQQQMLAASYHFVGTEAPIQQTYPTYWYRFKDGIDLSKRIGTVVDWLKLPSEERPHLITFYMSHVDHAGHDFGPDAPQTAASVATVDDAVGRLVAEVSKLGLPVNYVFVSDHGMASVDTAFRMDVSAMIDTSQFIIKGGGTTLHLYSRPHANVNEQIALLKQRAVHFDVYSKADVPAHWHYSTKDDRFQRIGDIILTPHYPKVFSSGARRISPGAHGFDPKIKEMHASFFAWGPSFKSGMKIPAFENIHIYPMLCELLGLKYGKDIDGNAKVLRPVLRKN